MSKVLFVSPETDSPSARTYYPEFSENMGLAYVAAVLESSGHDLI